MPKDDVEDFLPDHAHLSDEDLLHFRPDTFTEPKQFTGTYAVVIDGLNKVSFETFVSLVEPAGPIKVLDSNFGHKAQPGFEHLIKKPKENKKGRRVQGDGSCFNSCVEALIMTPEGDLRHVKCFPTKGQAQCPGSTQPDCSDAIWLIDRWVEFLNEQRYRLEPALYSTPSASSASSVPNATSASSAPSASSASSATNAPNASSASSASSAPSASSASSASSAPSVPIPLAPIKPYTYIGSPQLVNINFRLRRSSPRVGVNLSALCCLVEMKALEQLEKQPVLDIMAKWDIPQQWRANLLRAARGPKMPIKCSMVNLKTEKKNVMFKVDYQYTHPKPELKKVSISIYLSGKFNILGLRSFESGAIIYGHLCEFFKQNWSILVRLSPLTDAEMARRAAQQAKREAENAKAALQRASDEIQELKVAKRVAGQKQEDAIRAIDVALQSANDAELMAEEFERVPAAVVT